MRETELIQKIRGFAKQTSGQKQVITGIGDDCAVIRPRAGEDLVFTTDFTIEDRHFTRATHTAGDVGHKALARSLSDLAAMGAEPVFCLVSLAVPASAGARWIEGFYRGMTALARKHRIVLAGGDLARSEKITVDVMCCGRAPRGRALLRSGAHAGDFIYVTGTLGASASGFESKRGANWVRHRRPEPRIQIGLKLREIATAAMDISDGLSLDLRRLCEESHVGASLDPAAIPIAKGATEKQALDGGEDYELVFTASPSRRVPSVIVGVPVTRVGEITRIPGTITYGGRVLEPLGFDHFR